jgi:hypothetical protein
MQLLRNVGIALAVWWLSFAAPAQAAWLRAESENFIVFSEMSEARLREKVKVLEDYNQLLRRVSGTTAPASPNKLRLYLVRGLDELRQVSRVQSTVAGFYSARPSGIAAFADTAVDGTDDHVIFHEYAHHFMMQYHPTAYPPWYIEGFAEYMMTARFTERHAEFGQASRLRASWLADRSAWLPLERILFESGDIASAEGPSRYYAQSWVLTHYLLNDRARIAQLGNYFERLNRGEEPRPAFQAAFGKTPAQVGRDVQNYAFGGMTYLRMDRASIAQTPRIEITRLPASADDLLLLQASILVGGQEPEQLLARVRRAAARHAGDPYAQRVLAAAEVFHGDGAAAERLLTPLIAASPDDAELLYLRGMRDLLAARDADGNRAMLFRRARVWFARAHRADANHYQTLYRYAQTYTDEREFLSDNNAEILLLAHNLAPQVGEIRLNAAAMLLARREFDLAEDLLVPLASTAHGNSGSSVARELLAKARARDASGVGVSFEPPPEDEAAEPAEPAGASR